MWISRWHNDLYFVVNVVVNIFKELSYACSALSIAYLLAVKARYSNPGVTHVGHAVCACQSKQHCDKNSARTAWLTCITPGLLYLA